MRLFTSLSLLLVFVFIIGFLTVGLWDSPAPSKQIEKTIIIETR